MKKAVSFILCLVLVFALAVPAFAAGSSGAGSAVPKAQTITMTKHTDVVVRSGPGTSYSKLGTLYIGDTVTVNNWDYNNTGWVQIFWGTGYGYVRGDLIP